MRFVYASPGHLNIHIPALTAVGAAAAIITNSVGEVSLATVNVAASAPGIFTARSDGSGVASGYVLRIRADGFRTFEPIGRFDSVLGWVPIPIDFGAETDTLFLVLAGTGIRNVPGGVVTVELGGMSFQSQYAGVSPGFVGLDQINLLLSRTLRGIGEVDSAVIAGADRSNTFKVAFR